MKIDAGDALLDPELRGLIDKDIEATATPEAAMQLGIAASEQGDKTTAYRIFKRVTEQHPDNIQAWIWLGWSSPTLEQAEEAFLRAYELDPGNDEVYLGLRWIATQREDASKHGGGDEMDTENMPAHQPIEVESGHPQSQSALEQELQQAIALAQAGDRHKAHQMFQELAARHPNAPQVWVWVAGTSTDLDYAEAAFRRALDLDPNNKEAALGLRWVALRRGHPVSPPLASDSPITGQPVSPHTTAPISPATSTPITGELHDTDVPASRTSATPEGAGLRDAGRQWSFAKLLERLNISMPILLLVAGVILAYVLITLWYLLGA